MAFPVGISLLLLAAIWGASFLFMKVAVGSLGPVWLIFSRVSLAALFLGGVGFLLRRPLPWRQHWRHYLVLGVLNTALPFMLYALAARELPASFLSIINATTPLFGALAGWIGWRVQLSRRVVMGLLLGLLGVVVLVLGKTGMQASAWSWSLLAACLAPLGYGIASHYARTHPAGTPFDLAHGSMWGASLLLLPGLYWGPVAPVEWTSTLILSLLGLGVLCTGVAYLLYFRLIERAGSVVALSVTYLIPVFGMFWGWLWLHEPVTVTMLLGMGIILAGTTLVVRPPRVSS